MEEEIRLPEFRIFYLSNISSARREAPICPGPEPALYFAHFHEDDVDFEIEMENKSHLRSVQVDISVQRKTFTYVLNPSSQLLLTTLESNGKKLHFICQSRQDGQSMVCLASQAHGVDQSTAAIMVSRMTFKVTFSPSPFLINVHNEDSGGVFDLNVSPTDTIDSLKSQIQSFSGIRQYDQILSFSNKTLDSGLLRDHGIGTGSIIVLKLQSRGYISERVEMRSISKMNTALNCAPLRTDGTVRGVVCTGDNSNQVIRSNPFVPDSSFDLKPFIIEMRMAPKYSLVC